MARLLRIERAIRWMAKVLTANRDALPFPTGITDQLNPVIDVFGSQRIGEVVFRQTNGNLGGIEVFDEEVPDETVRQYLSMDYFHDDVVNQVLTAGRIIRTPTATPFAGLRDSVSIGANELLGVRNVTVGPRSFIAARAVAMGGGARMGIRCVFIDAPIGEYLRSIS